MFWYLFQRWWCSKANLSRTENGYNSWELRGSSGPTNLVNLSPSYFPLVCRNDDDLFSIHSRRIRIHRDLTWGAYICLTFRILSPCNNGGKRENFGEKVLLDSHFWSVKTKYKITLFSVSFVGGLVECTMASDVLNLDVRFQLIACNWSVFVWLYHIVYTVFVFLYFIFFILGGTGFLYWWYI